MDRKLTSTDVHMWNSYRDLSGNEFVGEFHSQIQSWIYLQTLNLARNHFDGSIPTNAFENMTQLVSL